MDLVELSVDGDSNNKKWLIYDASFDYEIGSFDGLHLSTDGINHLGDLGNAYYAAQTFNNSPDGRTIIMGWLRTSDNNIYVENKMPFNQQMSFPAKMELRTTPDGIRLFRWPIQEIKNLYSKSIAHQNIELNALNQKLEYENFDVVDLYASFDRKKNEAFEIDIRGQVISYKEGDFYFNDVLLPTLDQDKVNIRVLLDRTTVEIFTDDGFSVFSTYAVSDWKNNQISVRSEKTLLFETFEVNKIKSIWPQATD
jgi:sucrose-6-phosphate hydrolase SacC (GH32 family)